MTDTFLPNLDKTYKSEELRKIGSLFLDKFYKDNQELFHRAGVSTDSFQKKEVNLKIQKAIYCTQSLFVKLMEVLPNEIVQAFNLLTWEKIMAVNQLEAILNTRVVKTADNYNYNYNYWYSPELIPSFLFFKIEYKRGDKVYIYLPDFIQQKTKNYLPKPQNYDLKIADQPDTQYIYLAQTDTLQQIDVYISTLRNKQTELFSSSSGELLKKPLQLLGKHFAFREFYPNTTNKDLEYLRAKFIFHFLRHRENIVLNDNKAQLIKNLLTQYPEPSLFNFYLSIILKFLRNRSAFQGYNSADYFIKGNLPLIFDAFNKIPPSEWISANSFLQYLRYRDINFSFISDYYARYLYVDKALNQGYSAYERIEICAGNYEALMTNPFVKGLLFLFASLGLLDLAYDLPINDVYRNRDKQYLSPYDGVRFFRITELGRFVFGQTNDYSFDFQPIVQQSSITLDSEKLHITVVGDAPLQRMNLEPLAIQISPNRYKVTFATFLKDCRNQKDVVQKINNFKLYISNDIPPLWEQFFEDVTQKVEPLTIQPGVRVYKFNQANKELLSLLTKDEFLKKLIQKVDGFQVAISHEAFPKVKERLRSFGFLIDG